jgi:MFS family permease
VTPEVPGPSAATPRLRGFVARPWLLVFLPVNAASTAFSVALPLLILFTLHAGILAVALAGTLYNTAVIPASLFWGVICDRFQVRAPLLLLNYAAFAVVFVALANVPSVPFLLAVYALYGLVAPSSAAASNLLILERFEPHERPDAYASFSELGMVGSVVGILVGFFWTLSSPTGGNLLSLLYVTAALAAASAIGVLLFIRDPPVRQLRAQLARHPESLVARLQHLHLFFPRAPGRGFVHRSARWLREEASHEIPLMLAAGFLFNLATNLFNTSYTPYLTWAGLGTAAVFLVNLSNNGAQGVVLPFTGRASGEGRAEGVVVASTWLRVAGYAGVGVFVLVPLLRGGSTALGPNLAAFAVLGIAFAFYSTASSLLLFRSLTGRNSGSLLGANSALGGLAAVLGAASSGVLSAHFGYSVTFLSSAVAMGCAVPVWLLAIRAYRARHRPPVPYKAE